MECTNVDAVGDLLKRENQIPHLSDDDKGLSFRTMMINFINYKNKSSMNEWEKPDNVSILVLMAFPPSPPSPPQSKEPTRAEEISDTEQEIKDENESKQRVEAEKESEAAQVTNTKEPSSIEDPKVEGESNDIPDSTEPIANENTNIEEASKGMKRLKKEDNTPKPVEDSDGEESSEARELRGAEKNAEGKDVDKNDKGLVSCLLLTKRADEKYQRIGMLSKLQLIGFSNIKGLIRTVEIV